jgi:hypothetical protein
MSAIKLTPSFGGFHFSTSAATTIAAGDTPVKAAGTTTAFDMSGDFEMSADNRLKYTGATTKKVKVDVAATVAAASGTNQELEVSIWKYDASAASGAIVAGSKVSNLAAATTGVLCATTAVVELQTDDYIEVHVANVTGTPNVTVEHGALTAIAVQP